MSKDPKANYYDVGGIEVMNIIKAKLTPEQFKGYLLGNLIKYSCRANFKGQFDRDLEKIGYYQRELKNKEQGAAESVKYQPESSNITTDLTIKRLIETFLVENKIINFTMSLGQSNFSGGSGNCAICNSGKTNKTLSNITEKSPTYRHNFSVCDDCAKFLEYWK